MKRPSFLTRRFFLWAGIFVLALIVRVPASLVSLALPPEIQVREIEGSLWNGRASAVGLGDRLVQEQVAWTFQPRALLDRAAGSPGGHHSRPVAEGRGIPRQPPGADAFRHRAGFRRRLAGKTTRLRASFPLYRREPIFSVRGRSLARTRLCSDAGPPVPSARQNARDRVGQKRVITDRIRMNNSSGTVPLGENLPRNHPLLSLERTPRREIVQFPVLLFHPESCPGEHDIVLHWFLAGSSSSPGIAEYVSGHEAMLMLAAAGFDAGIGLESRIALHHHPGVIVCLIAYAPALTRSRFRVRAIPFNFLKASTPFIIAPLKKHISSD